LRLSIVIVNYNTGDLLEESLVSIEEKFTGFDYEVVVVDNASTDGSENVARKRAEVTLIAGEKNIGFASGCNAGTQATTGKNILFLNPDTKIISSDMATLLDNFESDADAGVAGCQNLLPDGSMQPTAYSFPNITQLFFFVFKIKGLLALPWLKSVLSPFLKDRFGQFAPHNKKEYVDWVTGAFFIVKRKVWEEVGNFDQRFFLFCEEIDYCLRVNQASLKVVFDPSFQIIHYVGASSKKVKPLVLLEKYRSYKKYFEKHHGFLDNFLVGIIFFCGILFWKTVYRIMGDRDSYLAYSSLSDGLK